MPKVKSSLLIGLSLTVGLTIGAMMLITVIQAEDLDSSSGNYVIKDPAFNSVQSSGEQSTNVSTGLNNYKILVDGDGGLDGNKLYSEDGGNGSYEIGSGHAHTFMADTPLLHCLEATDSTGTCTYQLSECGPPGCYDRARLEFDGQNNPAETVYVIEITTDSNWGVVYHLDGTSRSIDSSDPDLATDYLTETDWETGIGTGANVRGLTPGTTYYVRMRSLNGDFTESENSSVVSFSTAQTSISFDLDVGIAQSDENSAPYLVTLDGLNINSVVTGDKKILVDMESNARGGAVVTVRDTYNGLYSPSVDYTLSSSTETLDTTNLEGYGIAVTSVTQIGPSGSLGYMRPHSTFFDASAQYVGGLSTTDTVILCSITSNSEFCETGTGAPIYEGQAMIEVRAKSNLNTVSATDYEDTLIFNVVGSW